MLWHSIQYLRGFAAMAVVWLHAHVELDIVNGLDLTTPYYGDFGVDIFFVISGFIIWIATDNDRSQPVAFWRRRAIRVVPLYWLCTLAMAFLIVAMPSLFGQSELDLSHLIRSLLFIPHYDPLEPGITYPFLQVGWTLNFEMFFYASFGLALLLRPGFRALAIASWLIILVLAGAIFEPESALLATYTDPLLLEFLAGMLIGYASRRCQQPPLIVGYGLVFLALASFVAFDQGLDVKHIDWRVLCWGLPATLLIAGVVMIEQHKPFPRFKAAHLLGDASFSIYLSHPFALGAAGWLWSSLALEGSLPSMAFILFAMLGCALGGILLHLIFEKPFTEWLRNRTSRSKRPQMTGEVETVGG